MQAYDKAGYRSFIEGSDFEKIEFLSSFAQATAFPGLSG
jgi:hypothetical protein